MPAAHCCVECLRAAWLTGEARLHTARDGLPQRQPTPDNNTPGGMRTRPAVQVSRVNQGSLGPQLHNHAVVAPAGRQVQRHTALQVWRVQLHAGGAAQACRHPRVPRVRRQVQRRGPFDGVHIALQAGQQRQQAAAVGLAQQQQQAYKCTLHRPPPPCIPGQPAWGGIRTWGVASSATTTSRCPYSAARCRGVQYCRLGGPISGGPAVT